MPKPDQFEHFAPLRRIDGATAHDRLEVLLADHTREQEAATAKGIRATAELT